jgi:hypothetical protein
VSKQVVLGVWLPSATPLEWYIGRRGEVKIEYWVLICLGYFILAFVAGFIDAWWVERQRQRSIEEHKRFLEKFNIKGGE